MAHDTSNTMRCLDIRTLSLSAYHNRWPNGHVGQPGCTTERPAFVRPRFAHSNLLLEYRGYLLQLSLLSPGCSKIEAQA